MYVRAVSWKRYWIGGKMFNQWPTLKTPLQDGLSQEEFEKQFSMDRESSVCLSHLVIYPILCNHGKSRKNSINVITIFHFNFHSFKHILFRWYIVWQSQALSLPSITVARYLGMDLSTVKRTISLFENTGQVRKRAYPARRVFSVIKEPVQLYILHTLLYRPGRFRLSCKMRVQYAKYWKRQVLHDF